MITYGSYLDKKENLQKNAIIIVVMDTLVALMAGLCVIPGRFALDPTGTLGGPSLLFVTMQNVFDRMGAAGPIFGILFYLLVVFAAVSSSISLLEAVVAHFVDKARDEGKGDKRKLYSLIGAIGRRHPVRHRLPGRSGQRRYLPGRHSGHACGSLRRGAHLERRLAGLL